MQTKVFFDTAKCAEVDTNRIAIGRYSGHWRSCTILSPFGGLCGKHLGI